MKILPIWIILASLMGPSAACLAQQSAKDTEPYIHWRMERTREDSMGRENLFDLQHITFSKDRLEGAYSMVFDRSKGSKVIISERMDTPTLFLQKKCRERTISLWFKPLRLEKAPREAKYYLIHSGIAASNGLAIYLQNGRIYARAAARKSKEEKEEINLQGLYLEDLWNHVAFRFDQGQGTLFVNGQKVAEQSFAKITELRGSRLGAALGAKMSHMQKNSGMMDASMSQEVNPKKSQSFNGYIDDVQFYQQALSDQAIKRIFSPAP